MNIFKKIWKQIKAFFIKRPPSTQKIFSEEKAVLAEAIAADVIYAKILVTGDDNVKEKLIKQIARQEVAREIINFIENVNSRNERRSDRKKIYELHELRSELQKLEEQKAKLNFEESKIKKIDYPDTSSLDSRINLLFSLLSKNKIDDNVEVLDFTFSEFDKDFKQLDRLLSSKSTLGRYYKREKEKKKQREIYESDIKKEFNNLDTLISQNKLDDAKKLLNRLSKTVRPDYKVGIERISKGAIRIKEKELDVFQKKQAEHLKQLQEEAQNIKFEQERELEQKRKERDLAIEKKKIELAKIEGKENKLKNLLNKKSNWRELQKVLQENNITILYHFTDQSNLKSIKENGGLYSWYYCDRNNIAIPMPGNSTLGRTLDIKFGLEDFVRLSFIEFHPMRFVALKEGRITKPYLLKVSVEVCYFEYTRFSNMNATDSQHTNGDSVDFLSSLRFDLFHKNFFELNTFEKKLHQAEILVKTWIPAEYITNFNEIP